MNNTNRFQSSCIYKGAKRVRIEEECTLPDYCSDIVRVIRVEAVPSITSCKAYVREGMLLTDISGNVTFNIVYQSDSGVEGYALKAELNDSGKTEVSSVDPDSVFAFNRAVTEDCSCKVKSPRRINVRADICIYTDVRGNTFFDCYEKGSDSVQTRQLQADMMRIMCSKEEEIRLSEEIKLPKSCPPMERLLSVELSVSLENAKASDNSVSFWGNAGISCVYIPEEGENGVYSFYQPIELKGNIEVEDSDSSAVAIVQLVPVSVECEILSDTLGENRVLKADICYTAQCLVEESCPVTLTEDIYGIGCKAVPTYERGSFRKYIGTLREDTAIREKLPLKKELSGIEGAKVLSTVRETYFENGELYADCRIALSGIGVGEESLVDVRESFDTTVHLNLPSEVSEMTEGLTFDISQWTGFADVAVKGDELSLSFDLMTSAHIYRETDSVYVSGADIEERVTEASGRIYCYPCDSDTMWSVGKRYGVSIEALADANSLSVEDKPARVMVVPVK